MGYRMYVETEDREEEELLCGGKLFGYVPISSCNESYSFLKAHCYFTNQLDQLCELDYGNPCDFHFSGKIIKEFLKLYFEDFKKLKEFEPFDFDDEIKKLNDDTTYILCWL